MEREVEWWFDENRYNEGEVCMRKQDEDEERKEKARMVGII